MNVASSDEKAALVEGIESLFALAKVFEQRIKTLEQRTSETGLVGRIERRVTALEEAPNYGRTVVDHEVRMKALEMAHAPAPVDPLADFFANTPTAEKQEAAAAPVQQEAATAPENCEQAGRDILGKALRISDLAREAQGEWRSVTYTEAPGWTRPLKTICDLASEIEVDALDLID